MDLGLGITYEELCIKFSSILMGPKNFYRHFKKKFLGKLKISFLKKSQNILKIKSLFTTFILILNFTIFQPQNYLQFFAILTYFSAKKFLSLFKKKYSEKLKISIFLSYSKIKNSILTKTGFAPSLKRKLNLAVFVKIEFLFCYNSKTKECKYLKFSPNTIEIFNFSDVDKMFLAESKYLKN
ncbi:hypothetical protein AGLY_006411 [Aphis glycines]|uniref:Uncharacterized protein n=1 Tax=Aphis glycines TaxID=307491 RepID=A0A6G0TS89_APHGL|nr:hypothetical protein AGLY_006411 [Aphis glycines]